MCAALYMHAALDSKLQLVGIEFDSRFGSPPKPPSTAAPPPRAALGVGIDGGGGIEGGWTQAHRHIAGGGPLLLALVKGLFCSTTNRRGSPFSRGGLLVRAFPRIDCQPFRKQISGDKKKREVAGNGRGTTMGAPHTNSLGQMLKGVLGRKSTPLQPSVHRSPHAPARGPPT